MKKCEEELSTVPTMLLADARFGKNHMKALYNGMKRRSMLPDVDYAIEIIDALYNLYKLQVSLLRILTTGKVDAKCRKNLIEDYADIDLDRNIIIDAIGVSNEEIENFKNGVIE